MINNKKSMVLFELNGKRRNIFKTISYELYLLLIFNIGLLIGIVYYAHLNVFVIEVFVFFIFIIWLSKKRNRLVYKIEIDTIGETLKVYYYQYVFLKYKKEIPLNLLKVNYDFKIYMRYNVPKTLEIKRNNKLIVEIKQNHNIGWTDLEIDHIYEVLNKKALL